MSEHQPPDLGTRVLRGICRSVNLPPDPLRVAHLMMTLHVGGLERMVATIASGGSACGLDCEVWAYAEVGEFRTVMERDGITVRHFRTTDGIRHTLPLRLAAALKRQRIQVLHTHHVGPFLYGGMAAALAGVAHVHTEHSRELYDVPRRAAIGQLMPAVSRVVCVSEELASYRVRAFGDAPDVVPNGVPVPPRPTDEDRAEARRRAGVPAEAPVLGCVARLMPEKDHITLVRALKRVRESLPDTRLVLVGWGDREAAIRDEIAACGLADAVVLLGGRDDVESLLPGFDVLTLTSVREGLPLALLEGMGAGLPIVATRVGEIEALLDGGCGTSCAVGDADAIAEACLAYLQDAAHRSETGLRGRQRVLERYSGASMVARYARIYREEVAHR